MEEAKTDMRKRITKMLKFIRNDDKIPRNSKRELLGFVTLLNEQYESLHSLYEEVKKSQSRNKDMMSSAPSSDSDEYYSPEEMDTRNIKTDSLKKETDLVNQELDELKRKVANITKEKDIFNSWYMTALRKLHESETITKHLRDEVSDKEKQITSLKTKENERNKGLTLKIVELESVSKDKEKKLTSRIEDLLALVRNLQHEVSLLRTRNVELQGSKSGDKKDEFEFEIERDKHECFQNLDQKIKLSKKVGNESKNCKDQEKIIINKGTEKEHKLVKSWSFGLKDSKINTSFLERKMEDLAENFRMRMEDHIRILHRRIHVVEQIQAERKNNYRKKDWESTSSFKKIKFETAMSKLDESENLSDRIGKVSKDILIVKSSVSEKNKQHLKEAQELEAELGEEVSRKLNLEKCLQKLEIKVTDLEREIKEKDEEFIVLAEEKREAIRQLCILIDYHVSRYYHLKRSVAMVNAN